MEDAQRATRDLKDETERTARAIEQEFRDSYRSVRRASDDAADGGTRGLRRIRDGAQEVSQEMGQNLGETVSSIRGDLSDLGQVGQDTLGGLAATLAGGGPAGIAGAAAVAAGAVGLGLVTAELQKQQEEAEKLRERLASMYQEAAESGRTYLDTAQFIAEATDVMFNPDRAEEWKRIQEDVNELGVDQQLLIKANAGDLDSIAQVQKRINELIAEETQKREDMGAFFGGQNKNLEEQHLEGIAERWENVADAAEEYQEKARAASDIGSDFWLKEIRDAGTATEAVDEFNNRLYTLPNGQQVLIEAETGRATDDVSKFKEDLDGKIPTVKTTTIKVTADTSDAERQIARVINQGRQIKIDTRIVGPDGWNG